METLLKRVEEKLMGLNLNLVSQSLYLLANLAAPNEKQKAFVTEPTIVTRVSALLVPPSGTE